MKGPAFLGGVALEQSQKFLSVEFGVVKTSIRFREKKECFRGRNRCARKIHSELARAEVDHPHRRPPLSRSIVSALLWSVLLLTWVV